MEQLIATTLRTSTPIALVALGGVIAWRAGIFHLGLEGLMVIAAADGVLHDREDTYLRIVSGHLGITGETYVHIRSLFFASQMSAYQVLGLEPDASPADVKSRHRQLVKVHHPDRLAGMAGTRPNCRSML